MSSPRSKSKDLMQIIRRSDIEAARYLHISHEILRLKCKLCDRTNNKTWSSVCLCCPEILCGECITHYVFCVDQKCRARTNTIMNGHRVVHRKELDSKKAKS